MPPATLQAFLDHGTLASTLEAGLEEARAQLARLADVGVDLGLITQKLLDDGVAAFVKSLEGLMASISEKRKLTCCPGTILSDLAGAGRDKLVRLV